MFHLVARETSETRVLLPRLKGRIARAQQDIAAANPLEDDERTIAKRIIGECGEQGSVDRSASGQTDAFDAGRVTLSLREEACAEAARLSFARTLSTPEDEQALASLDAAGTWVTTARSRHTRACLGRRILAISRVEYEDGQGRTSHWTIVPLEIRLADLRRRLGHPEVRRILGSIAAELRTPRMTPPPRKRARRNRVRRHSQKPRDGASAPSLRQCWRPRLLRLQPGLFDRRAEHADLIDRSRLTGAADESARRIHACEQTGAIVRTSAAPGARPPALTARAAGTERASRLRVLPRA